MPRALSLPATDAVVEDAPLPAQVAEAPAAAEQPAIADPVLHASAREVALAELRRLTELWDEHEPGARAGEDPEQLHQLRVAVRRIDATLGLFRRQLPAALVRARRHTKALLRSLGATRDLDVQLAALDAYCRNAADEELAAAQPLRAWLAHERERTRTRMLRALDSETTRRWLELLRRPPVQGEPEGEDRALIVLPERVSGRYRKLRKSVRRLRRKSSMEDYHRVRRRAKQLRYAIESGAAFFGRPGQDLLKALRRLQDRLGAQQDAHTAQLRLAELAADPSGELPAVTLFLMGRLAQQHAGITADTRATLLRAWRRVRGKRWRALRARLIALGETATAAGGEARDAGAISGTASVVPVPEPVPPVADLQPLPH